MAVGLIGGALLLGSLDVLWPLVDMDLTEDRKTLEAAAAVALEERGFDLEGYRAASLLRVDTAALDYAESTFGRDRTQSWIRDGVPLVTYYVGLKRAGEPRAFSVTLRDDGTVISWSRRLEEDDPGPRLGVDTARDAVHRELIDRFGIDPSTWDEISHARSDLPERTDHRFTLERRLSEDPELRERLSAAFAGDRVVAVHRTLVVPGEARRRARAAEAPGRALETVGFALLAVAVIGAFWVFLTGLRDGSVRLGRSASLALLVFGCLAATWLFQTAYQLFAWEPLWPRWVSSLQWFVGRATTEVWMTLVLLALIAAGDAIDRGSDRRRGDSLWTLLRGRVSDPSVGRASFRGFLVGLACGGALVAGVRFLQFVAGAETALQPRGFFFYALNSASPSVATLLFFLNVALLEELGYRYFGGGWLARISGKRWVAILVPAVIYGLTHTRLDFLPPASPWWGRAVVMTVVGCVWGWAFFRYDALTVVLSHWSADLFIFNWPRLASDDPGVVAAAVATAAVPLVPAAAAAVRHVANRGHRRRPQET